MFIFKYTVPLFPIWVSCELSPSKLVDSGKSFPSCTEDGGGYASYLPFSGNALTGYAFHERGISAWPTRRGSCVSVNLFREEIIVSVFVEVPIEPDHGVVARVRGISMSRVVVLGILSQRSHLLAKFLPYVINKTMVKIKHGVEWREISKRHNTANEHVDVVMLAFDGYRPCSAITISDIAVPGSASRDCSMRS